MVNYMMKYIGNLPHEYNSNRDKTKSSYSPSFFQMDNNHKEQPSQILSHPDDKLIIERMKKHIIKYTPSLALCEQSSFAALVNVSKDVIDNIEMILNIIHQAFTEGKLGNFENKTLVIYDLQLTDDTHRFYSLIMRVESERIQAVIDCKNSKIINNAGYYKEAEFFTDKEIQDQGLNPDNYGCFRI